MSLTQMDKRLEKKGGCKLVFSNFKTHALNAAHANNLQDEDAGAVICERDS